jgi:hypothetical protein
MVHRKILPGEDASSARRVVADEVDSLIPSNMLSTQLQHADTNFSRIQKWFLDKKKLNDKKTTANCDIMMSHRSLFYALGPYLQCSV